MARPPPVPALRCEGQGAYCRGAQMGQRASEGNLTNPAHLHTHHRKNGELYYVGRASNLLHRLATHTSDLHGKKWDKLAIYIIDERLTLHEVESLLIAVSKPEGNKNRGKLTGDLKKNLKDFMKAAAIDEINASLYPNQEPKQTKKTRRITEKKIDAFVEQIGVAKTANILYPSGEHIFRN